MSQQIPDIVGMPYTTNNNYSRRLFLMTAFGYTEVANSRGKYEDELYVEHKIARIDDEYVPPTPDMKIAELKVSNAPSKLHSDGKAVYKIQLRLIFPDKLTYNNFMFFCQNQFKFYDERGGIYMCVMASIDTKRVEAGKRYDVSVSLQGTRKEVEEIKETVSFTDTTQTGHKIYVRDGEALYLHDFLFEFTDISKTVTAFFDYSVDNTQRGHALFIYMKLIEEGIGDYYKITYNKDEYSISLSPRVSSYSGTIIFDAGMSNLIVDIESVNISHWAKEFIDNAARLGLVTQYDKNGNYVYTFRPNEFTTRVEMAAVLNRLRKYVERVIRG
jgi:hypothetical protein